MRIVVIGAGAMGCTFGGKLRRAGEDVILIDKNHDHVTAINQRGLRLRDAGGEAVIAVPATIDFADAKPADLALVMVDSNSTRDVAPLIPALLAKDGVVLTLQNGIGNVEALAECLGESRVLAGCTYVSAALTGAAPTIPISATPFSEKPMARCRPAPRGWRACCARPVSPAGRCPMSWVTCGPSSP